ncbi:MAG: translation elongation factor Ts [Lachnospiraceae bacterium]|nr:translation elongation factor Ts [Lachnospiraceae bacterium]
MAITAAMVKELREATGVGMLDCKKALAETDGNMEAAVEYLREKGLAASQKKAGRIAAEGVVTALVANDNKTGVLVEVNSETDFVAKNPVFQEYVGQVAQQVMESTAADAEALLAETWKFDSSVTVAEALSQKIAVIGENLKIRRFEKFEKAQSGKIVSYVHGAGRIGVLIELACTNEADELIELGKNLAMQIAALNPKFIASENVPQEFVEHEKEILTKQAMEDPKNANKPENIVEKMIVGRLAKELKEFCLIEQAYVKETDMTVKQYIDSVAKAVGAPISISRFVRFETGEGLEKKEENFADEVAKAMQ